MKKYVIAISLAVLTLTVLAVKANQRSGLIVHEWGTFTSLQGSNGVEVEGLNHDEEELPNFVHSRGRGNNAEEPDPRPPFHCGKCMDFETLSGTPLAVTQKMETPVLYFYSDKEQSAEVVVDFPQGIIAQYFPKPSYFYPSIGNVRSMQYGKTRYDIDIVKNPLALPEVPQGNIYGPARNVASDYIRSGDENEKFIFYRGVGNFKTDVSVTSIGQGMKIENKGFTNIPSVFLINVTENGGSIKPLGQLDASGSLYLAESEVKAFLQNERPSSAFMPAAQKMLATDLVHSGLYADEAKAMVETWKHSYFKTTGLRVLYILSSEETAKLLPIQINPRPDELVRTLVGRIEVMLQSEEQAFLDQISYHGTLFDTQSFGRLAEAKLNRLKQINTDRITEETINLLLDRVTQ